MAAITKESQYKLRNQIEINFGHLFDMLLLLEPTQPDIYSHATDLHKACTEYFGNAQILTEGTKELVNIQ